VVRWRSGEFGGGGGRDGRGGVWSYLQGAVATGSERDGGGDVGPARVTARATARGAMLAGHGGRDGRDRRRGLTAHGV
jgi:hypothetical protein